MEISVGLVNKIIGESFGKGFKGNYDWEGVSDKRILVEKDSLGIIGRKEPRKLFRSNEDISIGTFQDSYKELGNGLKLAVLEAFRVEAAKYSLLYEKITGKEPEISFFERYINMGTFSLD